jgi:hypothetical protein
MTEPLPSAKVEGSSVDERVSPEDYLDEQIKKNRNLIVVLTVFMPAWLTYTFLGILGINAGFGNSISALGVLGAITSFFVALGFWVNAMLKRKELLCQRYECSL